MPEREFNLLYEPWICVLKQDCTTEEVSLCTLFENAHTYRGLGGELPTQDFAILRLLLAVLHAVFERTDASGKAAPIKSIDDAIERWESLWKLGRFPYSIIRDYLMRYEDRFWLFDTERPFFQTIEAEKAVAKQFGVSKLNGTISESANKVRLFPLRSGTEKQRLTYAEAARWLLHINAVDDCAVKKTDGYKKAHPRDTETEASGASVGWLGRLGMIEAVGDTLFETLMLNLVMWNTNTGTAWGEEKPIWENDDFHMRERMSVTVPDNQSELLTFPSRFLMLKGHDGIVDQYSIVSGMYFSPENAFTEQMTLWRQAKPTKAKPNAEYFPMRHDAAQYMWQEFTPMFAGTRGDSNDKRPGIIKWLGLLADSEALDRQRTIRFATVSVQYCKAQSSSIDEVSGDSMAMRFGLLQDRASEWIYCIQNELEKNREMAYTVGYLAKDLVLSVCGEQGDDEAAKARAQFFFRMDTPFREWLYGIDPSKVLDERARILLEWRKTAYGIALALGKELVEKVGLNAFKGRGVKVGKSGDEIVLSAPKAFNLFLMNLAKCK